jgi:DNA-3-methyladenine glycosylase
VLIRALEPTAGLERMRERRGERPDTDLCSGPGKLTEALGVGLAHNEADLREDPFLLAPPEFDPTGGGSNTDAAPEVVVGPRVGISKATERPWRFCAAGSPYVSRPRPTVAA